MVFAKNLPLDEDTDAYVVTEGQAVGLADEELSEERREAMATCSAEDQELARQVYYVTDTLSQTEQKELDQCKNEPAKLAYLTSLVNQCKAGTRPNYRRQVKQAAGDIAAAVRAGGSRIVLTPRDETIMVRGDTGNLSNTLTAILPSKVRLQVNMTDTIIQDDVDKSLRLLSLKNEPKGVYEGSNKLPKFLLLALQEYWDKKDEPVPILKHQGENIINWIDMVFITIARAIKDIPTKKYKLWFVIMQNPKVMDALPEIERFVRNSEVSYIRLCWEIRTRLGQDSSRADLQEEYSHTKQKEGEQPMDYCSRLNRLRQEAFGTGTDEQENLTYENSWNQHYEVCTKGLINKQLMSEVHRRAPSNQVELREAIKAANLWIKRSIRQGLVPGQGDPRALAGLTNQVSQMTAPPPDRQVTCSFCKKIGHNENRCRFKTMKCYACGELGHMQKYCKNKPTGFRITKPGPSIQILEAPAEEEQAEWEQVQCQLFQAGSC